MNNRFGWLNVSRLFPRFPQHQEVVDVKTSHIFRVGILACLALMFITAMALAAPTPALADGQYTAVFFSPNHPGDEYKVYFDTLDELLTYMQEHSIEANIEGLDPETDAIVLYVNYGGLPMTFSSAAGSSSITMNVPELDISREFADSGTLAGNLQALQTWVEEDTEGVVDRVNTYVGETGGTSGGSSSTFSGCFIHTLLD